MMEKVWFSGLGAALLFGAVNTSPAKSAMMISVTVSLPTLALCNGLPWLLTCKQQTSTSIVGMTLAEFFVSTIRNIADSPTPLLFYCKSIFSIKF
jgi:hypothetical protein